MSDFTRYSNYDPNNNFSSVVFAADSPILEVELNEMQNILRGHLLNLLRDLGSSGFVSLPAYSFTQSTNTITLPSDIAYVNGLRATIANALVGGATANGNNNVIALGSLPTSGTQTAIVFLEMWTEGVTYQSTIPQYGGLQNPNTQTNKIFDNTIGIETTRRHQVQWRLRVVTGAQNITDSVVYAQGPLSSPSSTTRYTPLNGTSGVYVASGSDIVTGTQDNNVYAVPMFQVFMTTTTTTITDVRPRATTVSDSSLLYSKLALSPVGSFRQLLDPSRMNFSRNSFAYGINLTQVGFNVLRTHQGKFGQGAFIEESTTNLVYNSDFEIVTGTATVFSDALTGYTGTLSTVGSTIGMWTLQNGSFTFNASGATSGANGSKMTAGNNVWKPLIGSNGSALALTFQATFTTPSTVPSGSAGHLYLYQSPGNYYVAYINSNGLYLSKYVGGSGTPLTSATPTISANHTYTITLSITPSGHITVKLYDGVGTGGTLLQTLTATDKDLSGGFIMQVLCDTGVVITNAQVIAPFPDGWMIGGDSRVAWGLTTNAISGKYSLSAISFTGVSGSASVYQDISVSSSTTYSYTTYVNTSNVGTNGLLINIDWDNANNYITSSLSSTLTGTNSTQRLMILNAVSPSNANKARIYCMLRDSGTAVFDAVQFEQKPYATTYIPGGAVYSRNWDDYSITNQTLFGTGASQSINNGKYVLTSGSSGTHAESRLDFVPYVTDFIIEVDLTVPSTSGSNAGVVYRTTAWYDANDTYGYYVGIGNSSIVFGHGTNSSSGAWTLISNPSASFTAGSTHHLKVVVSGTRHQVYVDGTLYVDVNDSTFTGPGSVGLRTSQQNGTQSSFDNFSIIVMNGSNQRSADVLSYTLSQPLPSRWFGAMVWKPQYSSTTYTINAKLIAGVTKNSSGTDNGGRYSVEYNNPGLGASGAFSFSKSINGSSWYSLITPQISFNANDSIFIAWLDDPISGYMYLWVGINNGPLSLYTLANTVQITDCQTLYIGCGNSFGGAPCNGIIDFPIITDTIPTPAQVQSLYQASDWGGLRNWPTLSTGLFATVNTVPKTIYVDPVNGNDGNPGTFTKPFKTIQAAVNSLPNILLNPVVIQLMPGVYNENVTISDKLGPLGIYGDVNNQGKYIWNGSLDLGQVVGISICGITFQGFSVFAIRTINVGFANIFSCTFDGSSLSDAVSRIGIDFYGSKGTVNNCTFSNFASSSVWNRACIYSSISQVYSYTCTFNTVDVAYFADSGIIHGASGSFTFTATTTQTGARYGGQIWGIP